MQKLPEAMHKHKGVAVSIKLYLQKQGRWAGFGLREFADLRCGAPLIKHMENLGVKYVYFHMHKAQNQPPS